MIGCKCSQLPKHFNGINHSNICVIKIENATKSESCNQLHQQNSRFGCKWANNFGPYVVLDNTFTSPMMCDN